MHLLLASDHAGFALKETLKSWLGASGHTVKDFGSHSPDAVDYPDFVHPVAHEPALLSGDAMGILVCGSGQGVCMTANKYQQIRAALAWNKEVAGLARAHNNANVLCLPARFITEEEAHLAVDTFLQTPFEGGRHQRRIEKIAPV